MPTSKSNFKAEITPATTLYQHIVDLVKTFNPETVLEIGSANGLGSTRAFIEGAEACIEKGWLPPCMVCLEAVKERFDELATNVDSHKWITPVWTSSVSMSKYMNDIDISDFFKNPDTEHMNVRRFGDAEVRKWRAAELHNILLNDIPQDGIDRAIQILGERPEMVLIDGSCFTADAELEKVWGAKVIILDDTLGIKNHSTNRMLDVSKSYNVLARNCDERNGWAIYAKAGE